MLSSRSILFALLITPLRLQAQEPAGQVQAECLADNVVLIVAHWNNGSSTNGLGFIVAGRGDKLIVVIADHVVRNSSRAPDDSADRVTVEYRQYRGRPYEAELLDLRQGELDLAVLEVELPEGVGWRRDARGSDSYRRNTNVWYVGRDWRVPTVPGSINHIDNIEDRIHIDRLDVRPGMSGGPLIDRTGIIGMIVDDDASTTLAVPIHLVEEKLREWRMWQLTPSSCIERIQCPPCIKRGKLGQVLKYSMLPGGGRFRAGQPALGLAVGILEVVPIPFAVYYHQRARVHLDRSREAGIAGDRVARDQNFDRYQALRRRAWIAAGVSIVAFLGNVGDLLISVKTIRCEVAVAGDQVRLSIVKRF